ncbi:MAG: GCN5-related N-acetyltransferase [Firmicutes bacterium]|nr:GCN5-related N-acetyltransferase [Bacillota bacterium]
MNILIRPAKEADSKVLTEISFVSKRYWNYPEEYFAVWKDELTITPSYIQHNRLYIAEVDGKEAGYFSLVEVENDFWAGKVFVAKGFWLEHIFIRPEYIGCGIGSQLVEHLKSICKELGLKKVLVFSDPNARGFYDKMGVRYRKEVASSIEGRTVSFYELDIN